MFEFNENKSFLSKFSSIEKLTLREGIHFFAAETLMNLKNSFKAVRLHIEDLN